jgi:hypothetical protein
MEVHFTPEQEAQVAQMATKTGTDAEQLVKDAVWRLLRKTPVSPLFLPAAWLPRCAGCARGLRPILRAGQRAIMSTMTVAR